MLISIETDAATASSAIASVPTLITTNKQYQQQQQQQQPPYSSTVLDILYFMYIKLDYKIRAYAKYTTSLQFVFVADRTACIQAHKASIVLVENLITIFVNRNWSCIALTANFMVFWIIEVLNTPSPIESSCQFPEMTFQLGSIQIIQGNAHAHTHTKNKINDPNEAFYTNLNYFIVWSTASIP